MSQTITSISINDTLTTMDCDDGVVYIGSLNIQVIDNINFTNYHLPQISIQETFVFQSVHAYSPIFYVNLQQTLILELQLDMKKISQQIFIEHSFRDAGISPCLQRIFSFNKFQNPTPIQYHSIKTSLQNKNLSLICRSKSGTGKTIAFLGILFDFLEKLPQIQNKTYSIILVPTRQLAVQIYQIAKMLAESVHQIKFSKGGQDPSLQNLRKLQIMLSIGGLSFQDDKTKYKQKSANIIVCTLGRLWELFKTHTLILSKEMLVIFDEGDKILGVIDQKLKKVLSYLPSDSKWLVFSATYTEKILTFVIQKKKSIYIQSLVRNNKLEVVIEEINQKQDLKKIMIESEEREKEEDKTVELGSIDSSLHLQNIKKFQKQVIPIGNNSMFDQKIECLRQLLNIISYQKCLVFVQKKSFMEQISQTLNDIQHVLIHGSLSQAARFRLMNQINKSKVIIASDLLSRGIDIKVDLVILFDARQSDTFWHRIGRTGRYDRQGVAISLDLIPDCQWKPFDKEQINKLLNQIEQLKQKEWYGGHMTQMGRWQQVDEKKQNEKKYKYFEETENNLENEKGEQKKLHSYTLQQKPQKQLIQQLSDQKVKQKKCKELTKDSLDNIKSRQQLLELISTIMKCPHCKQVIESTAKLTDYKFLISEYFQQ